MTLLPRCHSSLFVFTALLVVVLLSITPTSLSQDIYNPAVFNWQFYLYNNADLLRAGIFTENGARDHWRNNGIAEGRQAVSTFHTLQYEDIYPDIRAVFGTNYLGVIGHYLTNGRLEGRKGYLPTGGYGRYTVDNGVVAVSGSTRMAGAIDSVMWNGVEMINAWDHGRELQLAVTINFTLGECYNPTQAGSNRDGFQSTTHSILQGINVDPSTHTIATQIAPAFWLEPGERESNPSGDCTVAKNTVYTSDFIMNSNVQVGFQFRNVIRFLSSVRIPEPASMVQTESPTGYMTGRFSKYYVIDIHSGKLTQIPNNPMGEQNLPLIFTTPDEQYAMGAWTPSLPDPHFPNAGYGKFDFTFLADADKTNKWTVVIRTLNVAAGTVLHYETYIAVGTLQDVASTLPKLASFVLSQNGTSVNAHTIPISVQ